MDPDPDSGSDSDSGDRCEHGHAELRDRLRGVIQVYEQSPRPEPSSRAPPARQGGVRSRPAGPPPSAPPPLQPPQPQQAPPGAFHVDNTPLRTSTTQLEPSTATDSIRQRPSFLSSTPLLPQQQQEPLPPPPPPQQRSRQSRTDELTSNEIQSASTPPDFTPTGRRQTHISSTPAQATHFQNPQEDLQPPQQYRPLSRPRNHNPAERIEDRQPDLTSFQPTSLQSPQGGAQQWQHSRPLSRPRNHNPAERNSLNVIRTENRRPDLDSLPTQPTRLSQRQPDLDSTLGRAPPDQISQELFHPTQRNPLTFTPIEERQPDLTSTPTQPRIRHPQQPEDPSQLQPSQTSFNTRDDIPAQQRLPASTLPEKVQPTLASASAYPSLHYQQQPKDTQLLQQQQRPLFHPRNDIPAEHRPSASTITGKVQHSLDSTPSGLSALQQQQQEELPPSQQQRRSLVPPRGPRVDAPAEQRPPVYPVSDLRRSSHHSTDQRQSLRPSTPPHNDVQQYRYNEYGELMDLESESQSFLTSKGKGKGKEVAYRQRQPSSLHERGNNGNENVEDGDGGLSSEQHDRDLTFDHYYHHDIPGSFVSSPAPDPMSPKAKSKPPPPPPVRVSSPISVDRSPTAPQQRPSSVESARLTGEEPSTDRGGSSRSGCDASLRHDTGMGMGASQATADETPQPPLQQQSTTDQGAAQATADETPQLPSQQQSTTGQGAAQTRTQLGGNVQNQNELSAPREGWIELTTGAFRGLMK